MQRLFGFFVAVCIIVLSSECQAQHRGFFKRRAFNQKHLPSARFGHSPIQHHSHRSGLVDVHGHQVVQGQARTDYRFKPNSETFKSRYHWQNERFPKWIGGFHSSHFSNIGVPTGDLGFRGNGVYWAPW